MNKPRLIIGITGSSGIIYGIRLLEYLRQMNVETHLVVSKAGQLTRAHETTLSVRDLNALADTVHAYQDITSPIASGSFKTLGMIVAPCSMKSLSEIANGLSGNLIARAADVVLKERRRLIVLPREAPLHRGHLQNMLSLTDMGGIIFPPVPAFYHQPQSVEALVDDTVHRVLDLFDLAPPEMRRWDGL